MRKLFATALIALCPGCLMTFEKNITLIESDPPGALVTVSGFGSCKTPCEIKLDATRRITIAKLGYMPIRTVLSPGRATVLYRLELAAPTQGVETDGLPDL